MEGDGDLRTFTFLHRGEADRVALIANKLADDTSFDDVCFERMPRTDVWALSLALGAGWRGSYRIAVVDGAPVEISDDEAARLEQRRARSKSVAPDDRHERIDAWFDLQRHARRDPLAREQGPSESVASGPDAPSPFASDRRADHGAPAVPGRVIRVAPDVWWHVPPVAPRPDGWDVLVLLDGDTWIANGTTAVLDDLARSGALAPTATLHARARSRRRRPCWSATAACATASRPSRATPRSSSSSGRSSPTCHPRSAR